MPSFDINPLTSQAEYHPGYWEANVLNDIQSVTANTTVANVPVLNFRLGARERLAFRAFLLFTTNATADFKYRIAVPTSVTLYRALRETWATDASSVAVAFDTSNNGTTDIAVLGASGTDGFIRVTGVIHNGANAGDLQIAFAQNTSDAGATSVRAGSFLEVLRF